MNERSLGYLPTLEYLAKLNITLYYSDGTSKSFKEVLNEIYKRFEKIVNEGDNRNDTR